MTRKNFTPTVIAVADVINQAKIPFVIFNSATTDVPQKSPYFVQDALHDALAGKLYPELRRRGVVK